MVQNVTHRLAIMLGAFLLPLASAQADSFSVVGTVPGSAQVGAVQGNTLFITLPYSSDGQIYSMDSTTGAAAMLYAFNGGTDGSAPNARLAIDKFGNVYGTAPNGGAYSGGTFWEYSAAGSFSALHAFGNDGDGATPMQGPTLGPRDMIYGTTGEGAIGGSGNIFSVSRKKIYDVLYEFMSQGDGHCPFSGLAVGPDGTLYGTTVGVGFGGNPTGSVWSFTQAGVLTTLYVFQDGNDGEWPKEAPAVDSRGNVYGSTNIQGGNGFAGAIWKITASTGAFTILHQMNGSTDGYSPNSPLVFGPGHKLYGTTSTGGEDNEGTVFSITESGEFKVVHSFTGGADGSQPSGNLVAGSDGTLFGGTQSGTVFSISP